MQAHLWFTNCKVDGCVFLFRQPFDCIAVMNQRQVCLVASTAPSLETKRTTFFWVANSPPHSTPFAVCDRFGILLDKSGFNLWACVLTDPDRPLWIWVWVHGSYGPVGMGCSWVSFLRCRVLSWCRLLCPGARSDSPGANDFCVETLDSLDLARTLLQPLVWIYMDLRCIDRYDKIISYDNNTPTYVRCIDTYLPTYLPTYIHACMHAYIHT